MIAGTVAIPAAERHIVTISVDNGVGSVSILDHTGTLVWGQCGTPTWALECAAKVLRGRPSEWRRHWNTTDGKATITTEVAS